MKRYFSSTGTSSSSSNSKGNDGNGASPPNKKRALPWPGAAAFPSDDGPRPPPLKLMSWNVNSLLARLNKGDWAAGFEALVARENPDLIALQEVMLPAAKGADIKRRTRMHAGDTAATAAERELVYSRVVHGMGYQVALSLADTKQAGTLVMLRTELKESARAIHYNFPGAADHEPNGRFILLEFDEYDVLATYVPNHGYTPDSFERRRLWDARMLTFLKARTKPLVWLGDLNVCHFDFDVSHPTFFAAQKGKNAPPPPPNCKGQPGYTPIERERFWEMLEEGKLEDAYRRLHPARGDNDWTWRGYGGNSIYNGKGMRIDYTLVSQSLLAPPHNFQINRAEVLGNGAERTGFYGSDHCPILLELERVGPPPPSISSPAPSPASSAGTAVTASAASAASAVGAGGGEEGKEGVGNGGDGVEKRTAVEEDVVDLTASD